MQCPYGEFGLTINARSCVSCAIHVGGTLDDRFNFLCGRRGRVFKSVPSDGALFRENKHSLDKHRSKKAEANLLREEKMNNQKPGVEIDLQPITYGLGALITSLVIFCAVCYCYIKNC